MLAAIRGFVSKLEVYEAKDGSGPVETAYVAAGENIIPVKLPVDVSFEEMDRVLVCGEVKTFERRVYVTGASIRLCTAADDAFFDLARKNLPGVVPPVGNLGKQEVKK